VQFVHTRQALVLRSWLTREAAIGQQVLSLLHLVVAEGTVKGCASSGHTLTCGINRALSNLSAMKNCGVDRHRVIHVEATGACGSAKLACVNNQGQKTTWQFGNCIDFCLTDEKEVLKMVEKLDFLEPCINHVKAWFLETERALLQFAPHFMTDEGRSFFARHPNAIDKIHLGMNPVTPVASTISNHEDNESALPAVITSANAAGSISMWSGGAFYLAEGGIEVPHGGRDVLLVNGNRQHGVTPIEPGMNQKSCSRCSFVRFVRSKDCPSFEKCNLTSTKSISAPPKTN